MSDTETEKKSRRSLSSVAENIEIQISNANEKLEAIAEKSRRLDQERQTLQGRIDGLETALKSVK